MNDKPEFLKNPPAFPTREQPDLGEEGMTLRDWFAGQALAGLIADTTPQGPPDRVAILAYEYADAMIAQREG